jgi:hypothetical protein
MFYRFFKGFKDNNVLIHVGTSMDYLFQLCSLLKYYVHVCFFVFIVLISICCNVKQFTGTYMSRDSPHRFIIYPDSSFYYTYKSGYLYSEYSKGRWHASDKKHIKLQSEYSSDIVQTDFKEFATDTEKDSVIISVHTVDMSEAAQQSHECILMYGDTAVGFSKCDVASFKIKYKKKINGLYCRITGTSESPKTFLDTIQSSKYYFINCKVDSLQIRLNNAGDMFNYKIFNDDTVKITRRGLVYKREYTRMFKRNPGSRAGYIFPCWHHLNRPIKRQSLARRCASCVVFREALPSECRTQEVLNS